MSVLLSPFEGLEVTEVGLEIRNAAGGLRDALKVDPLELHQGDEFNVTLRCKVRGLRFDPVDKDEPDGQQRRVAIADAVVATIVDDELVAGALDAQAERIAAAKEIAGQRKLVDGAEPFIGYDEATEDDILARLEDLTADDADDVKRMVAYEEANGGRGPLLKAFDAWIDEHLDRDTAVGE